MTSPINPVMVPLMGSNENGNAVTDTLPRLCPFPFPAILPGKYN